jgi:hypothetical protein
VEKWDREGRAIADKITSKSDFNNNSRRQFGYFASEEKNFAEKTARTKEDAQAALIKNKASAAERAGQANERRF